MRCQTFAVIKPTACYLSNYSCTFTCENTRYLRALWRYRNSEHGNFLSTLRKLEIKRLSTGQVGRQSLLTSSFFYSAHFSCRQNAQKDARKSGLTQSRSFTTQKRFTGGFLNQIVSHLVS